MIEELTIEKLVEYGFEDNEEGRATEILNANSGKSILHCNKGHFVADAGKKLIYSGIDALRIWYFADKNHPTFPEYDLDLVPEYFSIKLQNYISEQKKLAGIIFDEESTISKFIKQEIEYYENLEKKLRNKNAAEAYLRVMKPKFEKYLIYVNWLNNKISGKQTTYNSFEDLCNDAILYGSIETPVNEHHRKAIISYYNFQFNVWLQKFKYYDCENEYFYRELLTKENWLSFIQFESQTISEAKDKFQRESETWKINSIPENVVQNAIELNPILKPDVVQIVFEILKDYFTLEDQTEFKQILETGNRASRVLTFKENGNRLTDTFKKLFEHNFIVGWQKKAVIDWIVSNFKFTHRGEPKPFTFDTVAKTINRNNNPCKNPLINIINGQIQISDKPRIKKQSKY